MKGPASKAATKMEEPASKAAIMKGQSKVTTVDPKKREQGLRVAEWNHQNGEKLKAEKSKSKLTLGQYYGIGAIMAVGALGVLGYYYVY